MATEITATLLILGLVFIGLVTALFNVKSDRVRSGLNFTISGLLIVISFGIFYLIGVGVLSRFISVPFSVLATIILLSGIALFYVNKEERSMEKSLAKKLIEQEKMGREILSPTEIESGILKLEKWLNSK